MSYETKYEKGTWNIICDRCGFQVKSKDVKVTWDGFLVCPADFEPKHPHLDPPPAVNDPRPIQEVQDEPADFEHSLTTAQIKATL